MKYLEKLKKINKFTELLFENKFVQWLTKSLSYPTLIWRFFLTITTEIILIYLGDKLNLLIKSFISIEEKLLLQVVDLFVGSGSWLIVSIAIVFTIIVFVLNILEVIYKQKVSTKQILKVNEFIDIYQYSKFPTPLDIDLFGRENEKKEIIEKLNSNNFLVISGKAGIGKTKIVIESIQNYAKDFDYEVVCIYNRGADLFEDINTFFQGNKKYLIFIDDVNRIHSALDYLLQLYPEKIDNNTLKIIMTVRDYAKEKIVNILSGRKFSFDEIIINKLEKNYIEEIIKKDFKITNPSCIERIQFLSKGNPRLAVMISKIAYEANDLSSIRDISNVYDIYYKSLSDEVEIFKDIELMKVLAIISFYRNIDRTNEIQTTQIEEIFNIKIDSLWKKVKELNHLEIVDLCEDEVVKITDQILSTYLFYKVVYIENILDIDLFIRKFFLNQNQRLNEVIVPIVNSFDCDLVIEKLKIPFNKLKKEYENDFYREYELIKFFWYLDRTGNLLYLKKLIDNLSKEDIEKINSDKYTNDKILELIKIFSNDGENYKKVIELMFYYYERNIFILDKLVKILENEFGFKRYSYREDYQIQKFIIEFVINKIESKNKHIYIDLFFRISKYYLKTQFESNEAEDNKTIRIHRYKLYETENLKNIRENILKTVFSLYKCESKTVLELLNNYSFGYEIGISQVENWDKEILISLINEKFISKNYLESKVVLKFCKLWKDYSIEYDLSLEENFKHEYIDIEKIFYLDYGDFWNDTKDTNQIEELIKDKIFKYIKNYEIVDLKKLFNSLNEIYTLNHRNNKEHRLKRNLSNLLRVIDDHKFVNIVDLIVSNNYDLNFDEDIIVSRLLKIKGKNEVETFIEELSDKSKNRYKFSFYRLLEEDISDIDVKNLIKLYLENEDSRIVPFHMDFLIKYLKIDENIILNISKILFQKSDIDINFLNSLEMYFNHTEISKNIIIIFKNDFDLLKSIYLKLNIYFINFDYDSEILNQILDVESDFILEYLKCENENKSHREYNRLWQKENYQEIIDKVLNYFYENQYKNTIDSNVALFFNISDFPDEENKLEETQIQYLKSFVKENIADNEKIEFIFEEIISHLSNEQRKLFIKYIVELDIKFENFKKLALEQSLMTWIESAIPIYQKQIEFFESLLELFEGVKYLEFKKYIEEIIEWKKENIKREKKNDFLKDF
ncbi:hypothetical protein [Aliarcobacter butzleri]|uniref:hypothetical protein n=1 Tax=Aliarcobacter butzleri TaxID=28197 RepID=UPI001ED9E4F6|nr:hypothetical protein [Aliarcobacter butzleri]MCG3691653.1 hypothetical protein [Aliarcobacter butzleri]